LYYQKDTRLTLHSTPCNTTVLVEGSEEHSQAKERDFLFQWAPTINCKLNVTMHYTSVLT